MYDFKLNKNEEIKLISDNTIVYTAKEEKNVTCIISNQRLLILDYPSGIYNSAEDLRISGKMTYIRKKEIAADINLKDITSITKENNIMSFGTFSISNNKNKRSISHKIFRCFIFC